MTQAVETLLQWHSHCAGRWLARWMLGATLPLLGAALAGCASFGGFPARPTDPNQDVLSIERSINAAAVAACLQTGGNAEPCRNELIGSRMYAIDVRFSQFEQDLFRQTREAGFAATVATLGLNAAGTLTGAPTTQILSAIAGGITGSRVAFEKEVLAEKTLLSIHTAMRANRTKVAVRLRQGLRQSSKDYPVGVALSDLESYYQAGTVLGALIGITEVVGADAQAAEQRLAALTTFSTDSAAEYLSRFLVDETVPLESRQQRELLVRRAYRDLGVADAETTYGQMLIRDTNLKEQTRKVARRFGWQG